MVKQTLAEGKGLMVNLLYEAGVVYSASYQKQHRRRSGYGWSSEVKKHQGENTGIRKFREKEREENGDKLFVL
ncbi:MAG: hypothetical protein Q9M20_02100 [Mariprofundaceae bacterium]|nr:hypothetical protein [Mariprofundaceae bacterium]